MTEDEYCSRLSEFINIPSDLAKLGKLGFHIDRTIEPRTYVDTAFSTEIWCGFWNDFKTLIFRAVVARTLHCCGFGQIGSVFIGQNNIFKTDELKKQATNLFLDFVIMDSFKFYKFGGLLIADVDRYINLNHGCLGQLISERPEWKKLVTTHNRLYSDGKPLSINNLLARPISVWYMDCNEYLQQSSHPLDGKEI